MSLSTHVFREMKSVVVRFAGDSGDGMQIVGERFTDTSVTVPNAIATFPDYPSEIRAPVGTIAGVSAFQVHFGSMAVLTPGDEPDALVVMNPAALAVHLYDLVEGGLLIVNTAAFTPENLEMAHYITNPLEDPALLKRYEVIPIDITGLAVGIKPRQDVHVTITRADGSKTETTVMCRIDTLDEVEYYRHGGILQYVLRNILKAA